MALLPLLVVGVAVTVSVAGPFDSLAHAPLRMRELAQGEQPAVPVAGHTLTRAEQAAFLAQAKIVRQRSVSKGVTGTVRVTLTDGALTHDASVQVIDEYKPVFKSKKGTEIGFRDSWRYNVAAYRLDLLLELGMVPVSVHRRFKGQDASFTWWVDGVLMDEGERYTKKISAPDPAAWNRQMWTLRIFDQLIDNTDRNLGNMLIDRDWRAWMIDHTRAFRQGRELRTPGYLTRCDRQLLARLKALDEARIKEAAGKWLRDAEIAPLLARRDRIVEHFERAGPGALFDSPPPRVPH